MQRCAEGNGKHALWPLSRESVVPAAVFSFLFAAASSATLWIAEPAFPLRQVALAFFGIFAFCLLVSICLCELVARLPLPDINPQAPGSKSGARTFFISFVILELVAIISLLSSYPAVCTTDSNDVLDMAQGNYEWKIHHRYDTLAAHHPLIYTLAVRAVLWATTPLNSLDASIFVFMVLQATYVSVALALSLALMKRAGLPRAFILFALVFYALSPVLTTHQAVMWKDVPFSATIILLAAVLLEAPPGLFSRKRLIVVGVLVLVLSLLRSNGLFVGIIVFACMGIVRVARWKQVAVLCLSLVLAMGVYTGPVYAAMGVAPAHFSEAVSMPIQQLAATIKAKGEITASDKELLGQVLPLKDWADSYVPNSPNSIKFHEGFDDRYLEANKAQFILAWLRTAPANPKVYLKAWLQETEGYWHPGYKLRRNLSNGPYDKPAADLLGWGFRPNEFVNTIGQSFPLLHDMGSYIWAIAFCLMLCIRVSGKRGAARSVLVFAPAIAVFVTLLLAAPISNDYRYVLSLYLMLPLLPAVYCLAARREA